MFIVPQRQVRTSQPQNFAAISRENVFGARVIDALVGSNAFTAKRKPVTKYGSVGLGAYPGGRGYKASAGGIGFPCDLSSYNEITILFEYTQLSRTGAQILFEHSVDQNTNAGSFILYTDAATGRLHYGNSASGSYDAGYVSAPALGKKTNLALRIKFSSGTGTADIGIAVNGEMLATTVTNTSAVAINFGSYQTYLFSRAGSSLYSDSVLGGYAVLAGFATDRELVELSRNPWQIFEGEEDYLFIPIVAGGGGPASITGTLTATLDSVDTNFIAALGHSGTSTTTLQDISATFSGTVGHVGDFAVTLDDVNATFSGSVSAAGTVSGTIAFTLEDVVASALGVIGHSGTLSADLADVMVSMAGTVAGTPESITGTLAITLDGIGFIASGNSGTITLTADDIAAIKAAIMSDPKLLTVPKFIALK